MASGFDIDFLTHGTGGANTAKNTFNKPRLQPRSVGGSQINLRNRRRGAHDGQAPTSKQSQEREYYKFYLDSAQKAIEMMRKQHKSATNVRPNDQGFHSSPGLPEVKDNTPMSRGTSNAKSNQFMNNSKSPDEDVYHVQHKKGRILEPLFQKRSTTSPNGFTFQRTGDSNLELHQMHQSSHL